MAENFPEAYLAGLSDVLAEIDRNAVEQVVGVLFAAWKDERTIFIIGNGGSAGTASHMMCDLAKGCSVEGKPRVKAMSLTDCVPLMTAISNDVSYEKVFTEQLAVFLKKGDVVVGITASGNSPNILDAIRYANDHGAMTIGLIGFGGGKLKAMVDLDITLHGRNYGHVEDVHCVLEHLVSQYLRQKIASA